MLKDTQLNAEREEIKRRILAILRHIDGGNREETPDERAELDRLTAEEMRIIRRYQERRRVQQQS